MFLKKKPRRSGAFASIYESIQCHTEQNTKVLLRNFKHNNDCKSAGRKEGKSVKMKEGGKFVNLNYFIMIVSYFKQKMRRK